MLKYLFAPVVLVVFCTPLLCQQSYYFRHYQVENGLSNNAVICSAMDNQGFLWFGTKDGLNRFNGYTFKTFYNEPGDSTSIGNNFIHCLYRDSNGTLWVGTERGLYKYNATTESFTVFAAVEGLIRDIIEDKKNLWLIVGFTLARYDKSSKQIEFYNIPQYFEATSLCTTSDGSVWVSTTTGLLKKYDPSTNSFTTYDVFAHSRKAVSKWIEKIYATPDKSILIGTSNQGAKLFDITTSTYKDIEIYNPDKTEIFVRNFIKTADDEYWIATESGVFIYNMKNSSLTNLHKKYNDPYSISDNAVYTFCRDKEGGIWAGTYFGGISYYAKQYTPFNKYFPKIGENSLSGNVVRELRQDNKGNLWIGTEDAGLNMLNTKDGSFINFKPTGAKGSISYTNIHGLLAVGNELWIGTFEHGVDILDINTRRVIRHYSRGVGPHALQSNFIYFIQQLNSGEIVLGTTNGAFVYNRQQNNFSPFEGLPMHNWYSSLCKTKDGILWAGTYGNGVNFYNTATKQSGNFRYDPKNKNSLCSDRVNSIFEDSHFNLWFATEGGLCKLNKPLNSFTTYTTKNGFPTNFMLSMLEDDKNNLWISTSKGLVCFNPATENIHIYTRANGLLNDQFNFSSAYKDSTGRMYFGSVKGLISFHPKEFIQNTFTPPVYITGIQVNNSDLVIAKQGSPLKKSITYTNKITFNHNQSTFSIDFAALSYTAPEMTEYAYMMEGLDKNWTYLKRNRKAYFTELAPGTYTFRVKASTSNGVWNDKETTLQIEILPPFWASTFAYACYALIVLLMVYYAIRNYHKNIEEKNRRKIELLEIAKEKEIFQAKIEFFTNVAHEIKTPLTLIKGPLEKVMKKAFGVVEIRDSLKIMERNTNRLIDLTTQLLDFRQTEIKGFSLNFVNTNISELLEDTYAGFKPLAEKKNLSFQLALPPAPLYASVDVEAFNKILSNMFSNAVKYAESKVYIILKHPANTSNSFTIEVRNDGYLIPYEMREKVFEPFFRLKETEKQKGTGIGLALSLSLAQLHKGFLTLLEPNKNMNVFCLTLPVHQENEFNINYETWKETSITEVNND